MPGEVSLPYLPVDKFVNTATAEAKLVLKPFK